MVISLVSPLTTYCTYIPRPDLPNANHSRLHVISWPSCTCGSRCTCHWLLPIRLGAMQRSFKRVNISLPEFSSPQRYQDPIQGHCNQNSSLLLNRSFLTSSGIDSINQKTLNGFRKFNEQSSQTQGAHHMSKGRLYHS